MKGYDRNFVAKIVLESRMNEDIVSGVKALAAAAVLAWAALSPHGRDALRSVQQALDLNQAPAQQDVQVLQQEVPDENLDQFINRLATRREKIRQDWEEPSKKILSNPYLFRKE